MTADAYLLGLRDDPPATACPVLAVLTRAALELLSSEDERIEVLNEVLPHVDPGIRGEAFLRRYRAVTPLLAVELQPIALRAQAKKLQGSDPNDETLRKALRDVPDLHRPLRYMTRLANGAHASEIGEMMGQTYRIIKQAAESPGVREEVATATVRVIRALIALNS